MAQIAGKLKNFSGFTLIELLVTIAVLVILATIAVPNFQGLIERNRIVSTTNGVVRTLAGIKSEALTRKQNVTGTVSSSKVELFSGSGLSAEVSDGASLEWTFSSGEVTFSPIGWAMESGKICVLYNGEVVREVSVSLSGIVSINKSGVLGCP